MIVTVTPNPSIDRTLRIPALERGRVIRATDATAEAGGKGVNVARDLTMHGVDAIAVVPLSRESAVQFETLLARATRLEVSPIDGPARVNVGLVEPDGGVTKINEPGPGLSPAEFETLLARVARLAATASWVAGCGSLPPGVPADFYARLASRLPEGVPFAVDADGPALHAAAGAGVTLLKPNLAELEGLVGGRLPTLGDVIEAARGLVGSGVGRVLVSLGADGAVYVDRDAATHADARIDDVANTVGAGDALLAGFLAGGGRREALRDAVAWSVAACRSPGTSMRRVAARDSEAVRVHDVAQADRALAA